MSSISVRPAAPSDIPAITRIYAHAVRHGDSLLLADGLLELRVESSDGTEIVTTVVAGGVLGEHKGINAPGVPLATSAVTPKDVEDLMFGLSAGVIRQAEAFLLRS